MADKPRRLVPRNPVVRNATVIRKGGAHGKSRKAERQDRKIRLRREIRDGRESPFFVFGFPQDAPLQGFLHAASAFDSVTDCHCRPSSRNSRVR